MSVKADQNEHKTAAIRPWRSGIVMGLMLVAIVMLLSRPYLIEAIRSQKYSAEWLLFLPTLFSFLFIASLVVDFFGPEKGRFLMHDYLRIVFAIFIILMSVPASLREYKARKIHAPISMDLIMEFTNDKDARLRALAILASIKHSDDSKFLSLIRKGLLDKDPLVRQAALSVIEENFGIQLTSDVLGINQAQVLLQGVSSQTLLMKKGSP